MVPQLWVICTNSSFAYQLGKAIYAPVLDTEDPMGDLLEITMLDSRHGSDLYINYVEVRRCSHLTLVLSLFIGYFWSV